MNRKLSLALALTLGFLGGAILSHVALPTVFAQSQPTLIRGQHITLTTGQGTKVGDFDANQGTIKLSPVVKVRFTHTDGAVSIELSPGANSK
jgi:hypothetical protein